MIISKEVITGTLANVERQALDDFDRNGYAVVAITEIHDLGHDGRRRSWMVSADVIRKGEESR